MNTALKYNMQEISTNPLEGFSVMARNLIGIDLGGTTTKMAFLSTAGEILAKWSIPRTSQTKVAHRSQYYRFDQSTHINSVFSKSDFMGIGMGTPRFCRY